MKKILLVAMLAVVTVVLLGSLRAKEIVLRNTAVVLLARYSEVTNALGKTELEQAFLRREVVARKAEQRGLVHEANHLTPALVDWLLKGDFSQIPESLSTELRSALALPQNLSADFVLVSKPSLHSLEPPSPGQNDKVPDVLAALLSLSAEQRQEVETTLSEARHEFSDWGRQNLKRQGPEGEKLFTYTIPMSNDVADSITNRLFSRISAALGPQRSELFGSYADTWFQIETGWLGGVTNTISVLRRPSTDGQPALFYHLTREGPASSLGEGPREILPQFFPPAWSNVFPGGWAEIAQREGFELPAQKSRSGAH